MLSKIKKLSLACSKSKGAGLVEVLVALVILAIGLLGVMSMQARGLSSNQRALFATEATYLAHDMANRIIAFGPLAGATGGEYDAIDITKSSTAINGTTLEEDDIDGWLESLGNTSLPSARATVEWNSPVYTITIRWDQERVGGLDMTRTVADDCSGADSANTSLRLTCFQLQVELLL